MRTAAAPGSLLSRRQALALLVDLGLVGAALCGCGDPITAEPPPSWTPPQTPGGFPDGHLYADNVDALFDVLLPAERDASGAVVSPGAREAGASKVLALDAFAPLAAARGLLPPLSEVMLSALAEGTPAFVAAVDADLDVLSAEQRPLTPFRDLPRELQEAVVDRALDDPLRQPVFELLRVAAFVAWLGAVENDLGLRAVGFPPFEDFADKLAVSGYPRTPDGRLIDTENEDLEQLEADGQLDDYTYNQQPKPTPGDDLTAVLDAGGDLY
jgi:hypothetical protein